MEIRFMRSARKHRIGRGHAEHVIRTTDPVVVTPRTATTSERRTWIASDDRGVELEIVAVVEDGLLVVLHVMPTIYRRRRP